MIITTLRQTGTLQPPKQRATSGRPLTFPTKKVTVRCSSSSSSPLLTTSEEELTCAFDLIAAYLTALPPRCTWDAEVIGRSKSFAFFTLERVVTKITSTPTFSLRSPSNWIFVLIPPYVEGGISQISQKMSSVGGEREELVWRMACEKEIFFKSKPIKPTSTLTNARHY